MRIKATRIIAALVLTALVGGALVGGNAAQAQLQSPMRKAQLDQLQQRLEKLGASLEASERQLMKNDKAAMELLQKGDAKAYKAGLAKYADRLAQIRSNINASILDIQRIERRVRHVPNNLPPGALSMQHRVHMFLDKALATAVKTQAMAAHAEIPGALAAAKSGAVKPPKLNAKQKAEAMKLARAFSQALRERCASAQDPAGLVANAGGGKAKAASQDLQKKARNLLASYGKITGVKRPGRNEARQFIGLVNQVNVAKVRQLKNQFDQLSGLRGQLLKARRSLDTAAVSLKAGKPTGQVAWVVIDQETQAAKPRKGQFNNAKQLAQVTTQNNRQIEKISDTRAKVVSRMNAHTGELTDLNREMAKLMHLLLGGRK